MKPLNNYIFEGFFNNVQADKESLKDSIISRVVNNLTEINKISLGSCQFLISDIGYIETPINKEIADKYFTVGDNILMQSRHKTKKHGLSIHIGYGCKWNKEGLKKLADVLNLLDHNTTTLFFKINEKDSGVSMKDITDVLKDRLPKRIFSIRLHQCNVADWSWLDGVDDVWNLDIYDSTIKSFKGINPDVFSIIIDGCTRFDDTTHFPHITQSVSLASDSVFRNKLSMVRRNMTSNARLCELLRG